MGRNDWGEAHVTPKPPTCGSCGHDHDGDVGGCNRCLCPGFIRKLHPIERLFMRLGILDPAEIPTAEQRVAESMMDVANTAHIPGLRGLR